MSEPAYQAARLPAISQAVLGWLTRPHDQGWLAQACDWSDTDWEVARWVTQVHGIAPLLHAQSATWPGAASLAPQLRAYLAGQHQRSAARVGLLLAELAEILAAFEADGLPVVPLKGSLLATRYYAAPGLRLMNDLDLLVRREHEPRAVELLGQLRYGQVGRSWKHLMLARPEASGPVVDYDGEHPANPRSLDLHTQLAEAFWGIRYDLSEPVWAGAQPGRLLGHAALDMPTLVLLQHLVAHAVSDMIARRVRLLHLHDIALVAARVDRRGWEQLVEAAQSRREQRYLYPALQLASRQFGAVPADVLAALRPGVPPSLRDMLDQHDIDQFSYCNSAPTSFREKLAWYRPGRERLVAIRHMALPDPGEVATWYPRLARPLLLPLGYACYGAQMLGWGLRRALGKPRLHLAAARMGAGARAENT